MRKKKTERQKSPARASLAHGCSLGRAPVALWSPSVIDIGDAQFRPAIYQEKKKTAIFSFMATSLGRPARFGLPFYLF